MCLRISIEIALYFNAWRQNRDVVVPILFLETSASSLSISMLLLLLLPCISLSLTLFLYLTLICIPRRSLIYSFRNYFCCCFFIFFLLSLSDFFSRYLLAVYCAAAAYADVVILACMRWDKLQCYAMTVFSVSSFYAT